MLLHCVLTLVPNRFILLAVNECKTHPQFETRVRLQQSQEAEAVQREQAFARLRMEEALAKILRAAAATGSQRQ